MTIRRTLPLGVIATLMGVLAACGLADDLIDTVDGEGFIDLTSVFGCGYAGTINYTIDDEVFPGTISGIHQAKKPGHHTVGASMPDGNYSYSNSTLNVVAGGTVSRQFRCPNPKITVTLDGGCSGKTTNVDISIDNVAVGRLQPGQSVAKEVERGQHFYIGLGTSNLTWTNIKALNWTEDWNPLLQC